MRIVILPSQTKQTFANNTCINNKKVLLEEWIVEDISIQERKHLLPNENNTYSMIQTQLHLQRKVSYYISRIYLILILTMFLGYSIFFLPPSDFADRTNILVTLFLATVALTFVINSNLPKISYNTTLDTYINVIYVLWVILELESIILYKLQVDDLVNTLTGSITFGIFILFNVLYFLYNIVARHFRGRVFIRNRNLKLVKTSGPTNP